MIDTQALRNKILDLAMRGKLVEQRPEEGTGEELYQYALQYKKHLEDDNLLRGRRKVKIEEIDIEDVPYDIPKTWKWVRLGELTEIFGRIGFRGYTKNDLVPEHEGAISLSPSNIMPNGTLEYNSCTYISWEKYEESPEIQIENNDVILVKTGSSYGKCGLVENLVEKATINPQLVVLKYNVCDVKFLTLVLSSSYSKNQYNKFVVGTAIPTFTQEKLANMLVPLPPIEEQKRIGKRICLFENIFTDLTAHQNNYQDDCLRLKSKLLNSALKGCLVDQRPEEGTGEELYQQIQKEKEKLIKEGKIKKQKPLPEITEDEKPFEIPKNWKWYRIGSAFNLQSGKNISASEILEDKTETHEYPCYGGNGVRGYTKEYNREGTFPIIGRQGALCGNINIAMGKFYATEHAVVVDCFNILDPIWASWFLKALNLNQYATATAQPGLAVSKINDVLIPLPPLGEQKRIVAKLGELLPLCDQLK